MQLLSSDQINRIESHLSDLLDRIFSADGLAPVNDVIRRYVLSGGKRIRPQLCVWTYLNSGASETAASSLARGPLLRAPALLDLACGWELFHAFLLAHDDIIDNAEHRRDQLSLHRQLASLDGNTRQFGVNLGIVAGDLMFSAAMKLWHDLDLPPDVYQQQLRLFSRIATTTGFGQAIDICQSHADLARVDEQLLLREYHWKTAAYTFEGPMLSAAILAGLGDAAQAALSRFALALGQAYQIQNDLLDLLQPMHEGSDLVQGKRTIALLRGRSAMSGAKRADFDRRLGLIQTSNGTAPALAESLRQDLRESGAILRTRDLIEQFICQAAEASGDPALPHTLRDALGALLATLRQQYFVA